jgi:hypothetical protein
MRVLALVSFVGMVNGQLLSVKKGAEIEMPDGVDWLTAGMVTPAPELIEVAVDPLPDVERAVSRKRRRSDR